MLAQTASNYYDVSRLTVDHMHIRKAEFVTEIILSAFIVALTIQRNGSAEFAVVAISIIHSFNIARAIEAYRTAKHQQQTRLESYDE